MRALISIFALLLLLPSCGYYEDGNKWYKRIYSWQDRETECLGYPYRCGDTTGFQTDPVVLERVRNRVRRLIRPARDSHDYWATSCEAVERGRGDCEEFATLAHKELRGLGVPDARIRMMVGEDLGEEPTTFHMFVAVYYSDRDFYIVDPAGGYTNKVVTWEEFSAGHPSVTLVIGFNLFSVWEFP